MDFYAQTPEQQQYMIHLNELHEDNLVDAGVKRFMERQREGRQKFNKKTGAWTAVEEESNTAYGAMLVKKYTSLLTYYLEGWVEEYTEAAKKKKHPGPIPDMILLLRAIDIPVASWVTVTTVVDSISQLSGMVAMAIKIARRIEDQMRFIIFEQANPEYMASLVDDWKRRHMKSYKHKRAALIKISKQNENIPQWIDWQIETCVKLGCVMLDSLINSSSDWTSDGKRVLGSGLIEKSLETLFGIQNNTGEAGQKTKYMLQSTQKTLDMIVDCISHNAELHPTHKPILVPPKPWTGPLNGGYHTKKMQKSTSLVKVKSAFERMFLKSIMPMPDEMPVIYNSINALQEVPYRINQRVFKQFELEIRRADGIKLPRRDPYIVPDCPVGQLTRADFETWQQWKEQREERLSLMTHQEKQQLGEWLEESREVYTLEAKRKGEWVSAWHTAYLARDMQEHERFWFVWNVDTRSRAYTMSTALSFQGNTYGKAMLEYADAAPVRDGIRSIMVYVASLWGLDKDSINDRLQWCWDNADNIFAVYQDTDATRDWWKQADEPWEFLAACVHFGHVITGHVRGMDVTGFETNGRVHFDGKCNSTQHFAMMLRDPIGAKQVNLIPLTDDEKPEDIYGVAAGKLVMEKLHALQQSHDHNDRMYAAGILEFGVDRSLLKKPTMTYTYGGTLRGCLSYLKEYLPAHENSQALKEWTYIEIMEGQEVIKKAGGPRRYARWLSKIMYEAVEETMFSVKQGMEYLKKLGWAVAKYSGKAMVFYTPIGFPVLHWEDNVNHLKVHVRLRGTIISPRVDCPTGQPNPWKMQNQLPPNFVHSLDATHMHTVVAKAAENNVIITPIHDSYGCRPCDAEYVKQLIRDEFVELYKVDRLQALMDEQLMLNPEIAHKIPEVRDCCTYGDFDIEQVRAAEHSFL